MKKALLFSTLVAAGLPLFAETPEPLILPEFYSSKISADGSVIVSKTFAGMAVYDVDKKKVIFEKEEASMGNGNSVTTDGRVIVGSTDMDQPVYIVNGVEQEVDMYGYESLFFHGITADGKRVVGLVLNPDMSTETMYLPVYLDVDADGKLGKPHVLPYPAKDWMGLAPQYASAVYISNDGKTIVGQVKDNMGSDLYPIIYTEKEGEWSFSLPTESLINPNKLSIPDAPEEFTLIPPQFQDYMTEEERQAYEDAMQAYYDSGYMLPYPDPADYMTQEEADAYNAAADAYNAEAMAYNELFQKYFEGIAKIQMESTFFIQNGFTMNGDGTKVAMAAYKEEPSDDPFAWNIPVTYPTYMLDLALGEVENLSGDDAEVYPFPRQILTDGTIIASTPDGMEIADSYVMAPGGKQYVPFQSYLETKNAAGAAWVKENFTKETETEIWDEEKEEWGFKSEEKFFGGNAVVSDDWSVVTAGVHAYAYSEEHTYESYVVFGEKSGISTVATDAKLVNKKYYDLNGLEVKDPSNGIYIVRAVYSDGNVVTSKKTVK